MLNKFDGCAHGLAAVCSFVTLGLVALTSAVDAAIYKWVDENGVTHYSEQPPTGPKRAAQLPIQSRPAPADLQGSQDPSARKTWQQQEAEFQQRRVEREMQRKKRETEEQATAAARLRRCVVARQNLHALELQRPVYRITEKGERDYFDDKERQQALQRMRELVEEDCESK